ncbi:MAG: hypothetical protein JOZ83_02705 [Silvibacterium sp.]|nr:hypothetical protein [Silvibacterium sp.]
MFERYTEKARRVIFFARYEASALGIEYINPDCLLLGLVRESGEISTKWLELPATDLRRIIESQTMRVKHVATSVDLPLDTVAKRVLDHAADECERLAHKHIDTKHLFLGLLREPDTFAARRIKDCGMTVEEIRVAIAQDSSGRGLKETRRYHSMQRELKVKVLNESGDELAIEEFAPLQWTARPPAIGEAILVKEAGALEPYRIIDVVWNIEAENAVSQPAEVVLKVRKEQS